MKKAFKKLSLIFILLFFSLTNLYAAEIKISGNKRIDIETIKVYGDISLKSSYSNEELNKILKNLYSTNFFEDIKISFNNNILSITVIEYPIVNTITIEGEKANKTIDALKKDILSKEKDSFIKSNISKDILTIKRIYETMGFNRMEIDTKVEDLDDNTVNLYFFINKGAKIKISKIKFIGDKKIRDRRLRDVIVSEENKFWKFISRNTVLNKNNIELDKRLITNYYKAAGYYDVQVLSSSAILNNNDNSTLTYNINAGDRYVVNKISTNINDALDKKDFVGLEKNFKKLIGNYYSPFKIKILLDSLDKLIAYNDLQFIEHSVNEIVGDKQIEIILNIYEGEKSLVERINVLGNTVTNEDVIRGELLVDEGDPYSKLKFDQSVSRLKGRNIFAKIDKEVIDGSKKNLKIVNITVEEKPTGEITAGAGVGTDGGEISFGVKENNWLGKGINLSTFLDISESSAKGKVNYVNPNHNFSGNGIGYNAGVTTNDLDARGYKNRLLDLSSYISFEQYNNIYVKPGVRLSQEKLTVNDKASTKLKSQAGTFNELAAEYSVARDERDRVFMPTSGYIATFFQVLPAYSDSPSITNGVQYSGYKPFGDDIIGSVKFYASAVNGIGEDVRISKRLFLGNRVRGFKRGKIGPVDGKEYIGGNYASSVNIGATLPNLLPESSGADINFFVDIGNLWGVDYDGALDTKTQKVRSSIGGNLNWRSPLGPVTFTLAKAITKQSTDSTQVFKFNLGTTF